MADTPVPERTISNQAIPDPDDANEIQKQEGGFGSTGHEVEPEPNDDMTLEGFDKK